MQVNITKRIDTPERRRYRHVILAAGGRVKPDRVTVDDRQEKAPRASHRAGVLTNRIRYCTQS